MSTQHADAMLVPLSRARQALAEAKTFHDFKEIRDAGHAALSFAKKRRDVSYEALVDAAEIVLRAERGMGLILPKWFTHGGDRRSDSRSHDATLKCAGITKSQSSRWKLEASVPEEQFSEWIQNLRSQSTLPTSTALGKLGKELKQMGQRQTVTPNEHDEAMDTPCRKIATISELVDDGSKFSCIYADPPWSYGNKATRASTDNHYDTMSLEDICNEPVGQIADDECHLYLWATAPLLPDAFKVIEAWGFTYKTNMVWVKRQMGIGNYVRVSHEHLLVAIRGTQRTAGKRQMSWIETVEDESVISSDRTKHSRKPREFREAVQRMSQGPYLEMYGREAVEGWTVYGNQIEVGLF